MSSLLLVAGASLVAVALLMTATAVVGRRLGKVSVVDTAWGLGFVLVGLVAAVLGDGTPWRRWLLAGLVAVWGLRLAWHMHRRNHGKGEDPRYAEMLEGASYAETVRRVFVTQGVALWFVALPVQVAAVADDGLLPVVVVGVALWLVGLVFEAVGDAQLAAYKKDPDRGPVMDRGLWAWTRHPNYFGDACVWWGVFLVAASAWPGVLTVVSPVAMTWFLVWGTGARVLEEHMAGRPGWDDYAARTSMFVPLPPKR